MDTFMDKLAQKLTAQEMIKANTAADAEEMKRLKSQIKEYRDILDQMQKLVTDGARKLENVKSDGESANSMIKACVFKIEDLQSELQGLEEALGSKVDTVNENVGHLELALGEKIDGTNENVHKECVKVYRNVQAVVVDENAKQTDNIITSMNRLKEKLGTVFAVSVAALIAAAGGLLFQLLDYVNII